ncbi:MAG: type I-E CRISPR-associated protein Cse1/CasA [Dissulfurispiraceae bacterium]|jgi:CRISPR system Cascade subunit CasA
MNVAFEPWIPVVTITGERKLVSLSDVFTDGWHYADLAVRPHERVALMRLFFCVAHAALDGPKDYAEWCAVPYKLPEATKCYLDKHKDSFYLFSQQGQNPWLQVKELKGVEGSGKTSPVALLDSELSTGNNSTLFDHQGSLEIRMVEPSRIALSLLTFQNFSSGGGSPIAQWKEKKTSQVGNPDAPCLSQSMAHCLFRGKNLSETMHLNLPSYERIGMVYRTFSYDKKKDKYSFNDVRIGKPVWEWFPDSPGDSLSITNATRTYLGRLVPVSRWVRLIEKTDQMYCCNGFKYDTYKDGFPAEATAAVRSVTKKDKKGGDTIERRVVSVSPSKATWRELSALLTKRAADGLGGPLAMENAPRDSAYDFHICAMTRDQASMDIGVESVFHLAPEFQTNIAVYSAEVEQSENISRQLRRAIETYRKAVDNDWTPRVKRTQAKDQGKLKNRLAQTAFLSYWTAVENNLPLLMAHVEAIGTDDAMPTREAWRKVLFKMALEAYSTACGQGTPRQIRAFAKGWQRLTAKKNETESDTTETKEDEE